MDQFTNQFSIPPILPILKKIKYYIPIKVINIFNKRKIKFLNKNLELSV